MERTPQEIERLQRLMNEFELLSKAYARLKTRRVNTQVLEQILTLAGEIDPELRTDGRPKSWRAIS